VDERAFIDQKQQSWQRLSEALDKARKTGAGSLTRDQLRSIGDLYRGLLSDLAFARTQQASEGLVSHLNELAGRAHGFLYTSTGARLRGIVPFFVREFPALFRSTLAYTLAAALIFFIGWAVPVIDPDTRDSLVPQKLSRPDENEGGSPLAGIDPAMISSFIMVNNIQVGILAFAGGVTAGAFTVYELFNNGMVIGAVAEKAAPIMGPKTFWSLILPHGIIELTAIFICGGAGLMLGAAIIAPGNLRRVDSLKLAGAKAIRLFAGAVMMFAIAAVIEGFITPSVLPASYKLTFAAGTAVALPLYLGFAGQGRDRQD